MAEQEHVEIAERTFLGRREKPKKGGYSCGKPPYGYRRIGKDGGLEVDAEQAACAAHIQTARRAFLENHCR